MVDWFSNFVTASQRGSKSTALTDLRWLLGLLLAALLAATKAGAPAYVVALLAGFIGAVLLLACWAYVYFMRSNPDALRSESYTLEKMRIEKGMIGDTLSGFREVRAGSAPALLTAQNDRDAK
jgi:hypothetical protein